MTISVAYCQFQWPRDLRRRSTAARLLRLCVRIPPGAWMSVCCECCLLSGRGLCDELITRPEESYRLWCVVVCDLETSRMRRPRPALGRSATGRVKNQLHIEIHVNLFVFWWNFDGAIILSSSQPTIITMTTAAWGMRDQGRLTAGDVSCL